MRKLVLPRPISVNNLFVNAKGGRYTSPKYKAWKELAGLMLNQQDTTPVPSPYNVEITVPQTWRGDVDNCAKACLDILQAREILDNDRNVNRLLIQRANHPETTVTVETMEAA